METRFEIYEMLQEKQFTKAEAEKLLNFIESKNTASINDLKQVFLTKDDKVELMSYIDKKVGKLVTGIAIGFTVLGFIMTAFGFLNYFK